MRRWVALLALKHIKPALERVHKHHFLAHFSMDNFAAQNPTPFEMSEVGLATKGLPPVMSYPLTMMA
ncbi:hypothetical protein PHLCEN_2v296 [Hermanssonia centrifuga]|uniref:Uncharacterized protein n=1 Tax=Hermanssonia centrifuga TaxID=98765 RepID=A0A2R6S6B3_9APHY|nr:hypothetical protein PHLCEN_2v296 [Hermanssonia centrifuga]